MAANCVILLPTVLGLVSILLSLISGLWCRFAYLPPNPFNDINDKNGNIQRHLQQQDGSNLDNFQLGVYFRRNQGVSYTFDSCVPYSFDVWDEADNYWKTAIVTYPLGWFLALMLVFTLFISVWCPFPRTAYKIIGYMYVLVCVPCQALTYLVLSSNLCRNNPQLADADTGSNSTSSSSVLDLYQDYCRLGTGGYLGIGALVGYMVTGTVCCCLKPGRLHSAGAAGASTYGPKPPTTALPPPPPPQQPVPPARLPPNASMSASQQSRPHSFVAGEGGLQPTTGSVSTQPTSFDEEYGNNGGGGAYPAVVAAGVGAAAAGAGIAYYGHGGSYSSQPPPPQHHRPRPPPLVVGHKTMIPPHRMSYQEQRDLYSAAGHGAAVGAHAGPDTVYDIPSVIVPVQQHPRPAPSRPQDPRELIVAAATGAAVGARARADTSPEDAMDVPLEVEVIADQDALDDDGDIPDDLDDDDENDMDDDVGTLPSAPVDLDEQDELYVAVAVGSEEGARARTDTLPAVEVSGYDINEEEEEDDLYARLAVVASRSHESPTDASAKPDPPSSLENVGAGKVSEDSASSLVDDAENAGETNDEATMQVAAATMMMGDIDQSAETGSDSVDGVLRYGGESDSEPEHTEPKDNLSTQNSDPNSYDDRDEPDNDYGQDQDEAALDENLAAESSLDVAEDLAVAEEPQRLVEPQREVQPPGEEDVRAAATRSDSIRSDRQDGRSSFSSRGSRRHRPEDEESEPHDDSVFM